MKASPAPEGKQQMDSTERAKAGTIATRSTLLTCHRLHNVVCASRCLSIKVLYIPLFAANRHHVNINDSTVIYRHSYPNRIGRCSSYPGISGYIIGLLRLE